MASRATPASADLGSAERQSPTFVKSIKDLVASVGEGIRVRNDYMTLVGQGAEPSKAIEMAMRRASL